MNPQLLRAEPFPQGLQAMIDPQMCLACGMCMALCPSGAIAGNGPANDFAPYTFRVDPSTCEGCGICRDQCPGEAIEMLPADPVRRTPPPK